MAFAADNRTTTVTVTDRVAHLIAQAQDYRAKRKLYRTTFNELNALSNAELADIGIGRTMIRRIALEAAGIA